MNARDADPRANWQVAVAAVQNGPGQLNRHGIEQPVRELGAVHRESKRGFDSPQTGNRQLLVAHHEVPGYLPACGTQSLPLSSPRFLHLSRSERKKERLFLSLLCLSS